MIAHRCRDCIWWDNQHQAIKSVLPQLGKTDELGFCRKHKPAALQIDRILYGSQPVMDGDEFCGEFRGEGK